MKYPMVLLLHLISGVEQYNDSIDASKYVGKRVTNIGKRINNVVNRII